MENKNNLLAIALVGLVISSLIFADNIEFAYALSFEPVTICSATNMITFQSGSFYHVVCSAGASASSSTWQVFNASTNALVSTHTIRSLHGSTSSPLTLTSGNNGSVRGISCDSTFCYFTWTQATVDQVQKWNINTGSPITYINDTSIGSTNSMSVPITVSGSIIYVVATCTATSNSVMFGISNALPFVTAQTFGDCTTVQMGIQQAYQIAVGGNNKIAVQVQGSAGQNVFHIWDSLALTRTCATSFTSSTVSNARALAYLGSSVNKFAMGRDANDIVTTSMTSCTVVDTISSATLGTSNYIKDIRLNTNNNEWYVFSNSAGTQGRVSVMTLSPTITSNTFSFLANGASMTSGYNMFAISSQNKVFIIDSTTTARMWQLDTASGGNPPDSGEGNQVNGRCGDGTALDCVGSGTSPFAGITGGQNATDIMANLTNGLGLTNCPEDGSEQDTCGSGLFLFLFILLLTEFLALAGYLGFTGKLNADRQIVDIALFMLIIGFVDLAIAFYLDWIPDIIFYTIVIITASLLAFGLYTKFKGVG